MTEIEPKRLFGAAEGEQCDANWAWAAGFVDGEGSFCISREKDKRKGLEYRSLRAAIAVTNTSKCGLIRLANIFQVPLKFVPMTRTRPNHKPGWQLVVRNQKIIVRICENLLPHLTVKRCVAELMMTFCKSRLNRKGEGRYGKRTDGELFIAKCVSEQNNRKKSATWEDYERAISSQN